MINWNAFLIFWINKSCDETDENNREKLIWNGLIYLMSSLILNNFKVKSIIFIKIFFLLDKLLVKLINGSDFFRI